MSRIGKAPIRLPDKTKVVTNGDTVTIEGPKGKLEQPLQPGIEVRVEDGVVTLHRSGSSGPERALHGLARALLANAVVGVTEGFRRELEIVGVGYRGEVKGREVHLALGYSHPVVYPIPEGIDVNVDDRANRIAVSGIDKQQVGQVAADLRSLRKPDAYKGKGIRYRDEIVRLKVGKAAATV
ncbi:MAG: 50S ribosomal protein L6 [Acidobacteria bacterium]|nr:50S ribosomal protein L6 [Acidobacteriota bacterium]